MSTSNIAKIILLNKIYSKLNRQNYPCWKIDLKQNVELLRVFKSIGQGSYFPTETEIKKHSLVREGFVVNLFNSAAYIRAVSIPEMPASEDKIAIYSDWTIRLGTNLLRLKQSLGLESSSTNFYIVNRQNFRVLVKSKKINENYLNLQIGSHRLNLRYGINPNGEIILLYCTKYNKKIIHRFELSDEISKQINETYLNSYLSRSDFLIGIDPEVKSTSQKLSNPVREQKLSSSTPGSNTINSNNGNSFNTITSSSLSLERTTPSLFSKILQTLISKTLRFVNYFKETDFSYENFSDMNFSGYNLTGCTFKNSNLSRSYFWHADLSYANLSDTNLSHADLTNVDLSYADLTNANLSYADLTNANLSYADLTNVDLTRVNLTNANTINTILQKKIVASKV